MKKILDALFVLCVAVVLVLPKSAFSSGVNDTSFTALLTADLAAATTVYQGVVTQSRPSRSSVTGLVSSQVVLRKTAVLKGSDPNTTRTVTIDGGTVGEFTTETSVTPLLTNGDRVVVLLDGSGNPMPGRYLYKLGASSDTVDGIANLTLGDIIAAIG